MKSIPWKTVLITAAVVALIFRVQKIRQVVVGS